MKHASIFFWIFPVLLITKAQGTESTTSCPDYCHCHGSENITAVCCTGDFPSPFTVPDLPNNTVSADFSRCRLQAYPGTVVSKLPRLQYLNIANFEAPWLFLQDSADQLPNLRVLNVSMGILQEVLIDIPITFPRLEKLDLHGNKLYKVPQLSGVKYQGQLRYLDLRDNRLTALSPSDRTALDKFKEAFPAAEIDLRDNPFDCRCSKDTYEFVQWFQANNASLTRGYEIACLAPPPYKDNRYLYTILNLQLRNYVWYNIECQFNDIKVTGFVAAFALIVLIYAQQFCEWKYTPSYFIRIFYSSCGYCCYKLKNNSTCSQDLEPTLVMKPPPPNSLSGYVNIDRDDPRPRVYVIFDETDRQNLVPNFVKTRLKDLIGPDYYPFTNASLGPGAPVPASVDVAVSISACSLVIISSGLLENPSAMSGVLSALSKSPLHPLFVIYGPAFTGDVLKGFVEWVSKDAAVVKRLLTLGRYVEWLENDDRVTVLARVKISNHLRAHSNIQEVDEDAYFSSKDNLSLVNVDDAVHIEAAENHHRDIQNASETIELGECASNSQEVDKGGRLAQKEQRMKEELLQCFRYPSEYPKARCDTRKDIKLARNGVDDATPSDSLETVTTHF